jgi:hypothetical protein
MRRNLLTYFIVISCFLTAASAAFGCACCAEPGTYSIWTSKPDSYYYDVLNGIKFGRNAALYMTEAGFDGIKGLEALRKEYESGSLDGSPEEFGLVNSFAHRTWRFEVKTKSGKSGTVVLPVPARMSIFKADIHDNSDTGNGPILYKEFRFQGNVSAGTGFFKSGVVSPTSYFLVFQGRGNECDNASDFTHWRLEITGRKSSYAFFGTTASGSAMEKQARAEILQ